MTMERRLPECRWCDRQCPRCRYPISGGWEHVEQVQAPESRHVVCSLKRLQPRPLGVVLFEFFEHHRHSNVGYEHVGVFMDEDDWKYLRRFPLSVP